MLNCRRLTQDFIVKDLVSRVGRGNKTEIYKVGPYEAQLMVKYRTWGLPFLEPYLRMGQQRGLSIPVTGFRPSAVVRLIQLASTRRTSQGPNYPPQKSSTDKG